MKEQATNELARTFLSVVAGVLTTIAVGALLWPLVEILGNKLFPTAPTENAWRDNLMLDIVLFTWVFIASMAGGIVCSLISTTKDTIHVVINSLVSIVLIFVVSKGEVWDENQFWFSLLILLGIPFGNLFGGWIGGNLKRKKKNSASIS